VRRERVSRQSELWYFFHVLSALALDVVLYLYLWNINIFQNAHINEHYFESTLLWDVKTRWKSNVLIAFVDL